MKKKRDVFILLCMVLAFAIFGLTGCGGEAPGNEDPSDLPEVSEQEYRITLFFANEEYIATGDESMEKFMVFESELTSKPGDVYHDALELLKISPEEGYGTAVTEQIKFNDVYLDGDTAIVDFDSNGLNGGSTSEVFLISQIVNTLIHSFDEVTQVQFLVDGETAETIMGHVGTADPFTKDLFTE